MQPIFDQRSKIAEIFHISKYFLHLYYIFKAKKELKMAKRAFLTSIMLDSEFRKSFVYRGYEPFRPKSNILTC